MSLTIEDETTIAAIRRLAERTGRSVEDVVRSAVITEDAQTARQSSRATGTVSPEEQARRRAALHQIQEEFASWPKTGLKADKAFYDSLNDDDR